MQLNGYDCGIFAVATVLHLLERIDLTSRSFTQSLLAKTLRSDGFLLKSSVFRDCFPLLLARHIVNATGAEVIHNHLLCTNDNRRSTRSMNPLLLEGFGYSAGNAIDLCWQDDIIMEPPKGTNRKKNRKLRRQTTRTIMMTRRRRRRRTRTTR